MNVDTVLQYFTQYGAIAIFVMVLLEYMNLPGFPAGIIMPLAGIWAKGGGISFLMTMILTLAAGVLGSWILYGVGRFGGSPLLKWYLKRFPKHQKAIEKNFDIIRKKGYIGVFLSKLVPMVRTLISIPAGIMELNFAKYTIASAGGVFVWNLVFVGAGYVMGNTVFQIFG